MESLSSWLVLYCMNYEIIFDMKAKLKQTWLIYSNFAWPIPKDMHLLLHIAAKTFCHVIKEKSIYLSRRPIAYLT